MNSYREKRGEYGKLCEEKRGKERERLTREIAAARTASNVWEIINRARIGRKRSNESIEKEEWKEYFMELLGGVGEVVRMGTGGGGREAEEGEISKEEIREVVLKLWEEKAMGADGIPNGAWKCSSEGAWEICVRV